MGLLDDPTSFMESDDFDLEVRLPTGLICPGCNKEIEADDDVALVQVVRGEILRGLLKIEVVEEEGGDYLFTPVFFHLKPCWADVLSDLERIGEDSKVFDPLGRIHCETCDSGIRDGEVLVHAQYGEFHSNPRQPRNTTGTSYTFKQLEEAEATSEICLSCILNVVGSELAVWEDLSENGECAYCTHSRCWRFAQCVCACHEANNE